jgi:MerR family redox-sensitive transcriptional activator SoxR
MNTPQRNDHLSIGDLAARAGVATSALRFYESLGLIASWRTDGAQRRYPRHTLRRLGFIRAAQALGLQLPEIAAALATLPQARTPTKADWAALSQAWLPQIEARIAALELLKTKLTHCIGCGCLSLKTCALNNPGDQVASRGPGPVWLQPLR